MKVEGQETPKGWVKVKQEITSKGKVVEVFLPKKKKGRRGK